MTKGGNGATLFLIIGEHMSLYKQFKTDENLEKSGIWFQYGFNYEGKPIRILCARAGGSNTKFLSALERKGKPYRSLIQNDSMDKDLIKRLTIEAYAEKVVLNWENVENAEGEELEFSVEACIKLFEDLPDLFTDLQEQTQKSAFFKAEINEADAKN